MNTATGGKIRLHELITYSTQFELREPIAFARALKHLTDRNHGLIWIVVRCSSEADCWFD
jgi:hypothetical protein